MSLWLSKTASSFPFSVASFVKIKSSARKDLIIYLKTGKCVTNHSLHYNKLPLYSNCTALVYCKEHNSVTVGIYICIPNWLSRTQVLVRLFGCHKCFTFYHSGDYLRLCWLSILAAKVVLLLVCTLIAWEWYLFKSDSSFTVYTNWYLSYRVNFFPVGIGTIAHRLVRSINLCLLLMSLEASSSKANVSSHWDRRLCAIDIPSIKEKLNLLLVTWTRENMRYMFLLEGTKEKLTVYIYFPVSILFILCPHIYIYIYMTY